MQGGYAKFGSRILPCVFSHDVQQGNKLRNERYQQMTS